MNVLKIKTYSRIQPFTYKPSTDPQNNVKEISLNDKTLVVDSFNDTFDKLLAGENLRPESPNKIQNDMNELFKKPLSEKLKKVKNKRRKENNKLDDKESPVDEFDKPKQKKRQKNRVAKNKIKKNKQKVISTKKKVLLKGIENLQLKECSVKLNKCSSGYNLGNNHESLENNSKQHSLNVLGDFNKSKGLNTFPNYLSLTGNLSSSTPRDHKPRMVVNVQNISPITLHKNSRHNFKKRVSILLPGKKAEKSNVLKELTVDNVRNISFDDTINFEKSRKNTLKQTSIEGNLVENNLGKMGNDEQNKITEEINDADQNNCTVSELLDSQKLHNNIDIRKSHESLNISGQFTIAQQNTIKQSSNNVPVTNKKKNQSENFTDSPLLFEESIYDQSHTIDGPIDSQKHGKKINSEIEVLLNNLNHQKLDQDKVNTRSRVANSVINESSFIPDDWTNDYNSTYEYSLVHKEESNHNKTEADVQLNKDSLNNFKENTLENANMSLELFTDENEKRSKLFDNTEQDKYESASLQEKINTESINHNNTNDQTVKNIHEINKAGIHEETISFSNDTRSSRYTGTKRKSYQVQDSAILKNKEPVICINKIDEMVIKKRKMNKKSISNNMSKNIVSKEITAGKVTSEENKMFESNVNKFVTDDKLDMPVDMSKNNKQVVLKISKIENQNFKDILSGFPHSVSEKLKMKLEKAPEKTSKITEQSENESNYSANNDDNDNSKNNTQDINVLLSKLKDTTRITMRRKTVKKWDKPLAAITEDQIDESSKSLYNEVPKDKTLEKINVKRQNPSICKNNDENYLPEENEINKSMYDRQSQPIFLKPGKSWARSLSIINHFHELNSQNLEELAVGRGKNWRHSVQSVLDMQPEGTLHNLSNNIDEERDFHSCSLTTQVPVRRETNPYSLASTTLSRVSRFSMRIIPDGKRSTLTDDFVNSERNSATLNRTRKTYSLRKTSLKIRRDTLIETEEDLINSAQDIILKRCNQNSYLPFEVCFPDSYIDNCSKIGEGVYGEVFLHTSDEGKKSVIKIIPIEGNELVNCEPQKKFHEILSEIIIAEELHKLRLGDEYNTNGFVGVNRIMCVIGKYPQKLIDLWNVYDIKKKSENDCPSMFKDGQLYIIFELAHGGQDLEAFVFQNAAESFSIFLQTAFTLAVAEKSLEFEHRDLHWGNILISKTDETEISFKLQDDEFLLSTKGVKVSVIDFTLSRMSYQGCKIFNDLATDPSLFAAQGEYQFEIYRLMRNAVNNDWQQFNPFTNILWLDYTLYKMITAARYKKKTTKIHKTSIQQMKDLRKEILNYTSAYDFVKNCNIIANIINA